MNIDASGMTQFQFTINIDVTLTPDPCLTATIIAASTFTNAFTWHVGEAGNFIELTEKSYFHPTLSVSASGCGSLSSVAVYTNMLSLAGSTTIDSTTSPLSYDEGEFNWSNADSLWLD